MTDAHNYNCTNADMCLNYGMPADIQLYQVYSCKLTKRVHTLQSVNATK